MLLGETILLISDLLPSENFGNVNSYSNDNIL